MKISLIIIAFLTVAFGWWMVKKEIVSSKWAIINTIYVAIIATGYCVFF